MTLEKCLKPMSEAPRDGTMIIARFREWNKPDGAMTFQPVWWMPDSKGKNPRWKRYGTLDTTAFADVWVTPAEFAAHGEDDQPQARRAPEPEKDYDL